MGRGRAGGRAPARERRGDPRQDHDARIRLEGDRRQPADRHHPQPVEHATARPAAAAPAPPSARRRHGAAASRHRRRRLDPHPRVVLRHLRHQADLRPRAASSPPSPFAVVSHAGPMTRTVGDAALMLTVLAGADDRDAYALPPRRPRLPRRARGRREGPAHRVQPARSAMPRSIPKSRAPSLRRCKVFDRARRHCRGSRARVSKSPRDAFYVAVGFGRRQGRRRAFIHASKRRWIPACVAMAEVGEQLQRRDYLDAEGDPRGADAAHEHVPRANTTCC